MWSFLYIGSSFGSSYTIIYLVLITLMIWICGDDLTNFPFNIILNFLYISPFVSNYKFSLKNNFTSILCKLLYAFMMKDDILKLDSLKYKYKMITKD